MTSQGVDDEKPFVGREDLLREVAIAEVPLLVLHGDSGIGKSEVLRRAATTTDRRLALPPVEVFAGDGAAQHAILDALAHGLDDLLRSEPDRFIRPQVVDFVRRLAVRGSSETFDIVGSIVASRLRDRLGDPATDTLRAVWEEARGTLEGGIEGSIAALRDRRTAEALLQVAGQLRLAAGRDAIVVSLDRIELLPEGDVRLLADLARASPEGVLFRAAVMDAGSRGPANVELLRDLARDVVSMLAVPPLETTALRALLIKEGVDPALAEEVRLRTGGYPLHVGDAVRHLQDGGGIGELPLHREFGQLIESAWNRLDAGVRQVARQLCVLDRPPRLSVLLDLLDVDEADWWDSASRLEHARVFTQTVDDLPWFHEQRRQWLLHKLNAAERAGYAARTLPAIAHLATEPSGWPHRLSLAALLDMADDQIDDARLKLVAGLGDTQLAVEGALLELYEPSSPAIDARSALQHAREHFSAKADLIEALKWLDERGLVAVAENERAAVVVPVIDALMAAAIAGRCQRRLGRTPIPHLASTVWSAALAPTDVVFDHAIVGVGAPSPGNLVRDLTAEISQQTGVFGARFSGCVAYGSHRRTPIYAVAAATGQDTPALAEAWRRARREIADGTFTVMSVLEYPARRVRTNRWKLAVDDVTRGLPDGDGARDLLADLKRRVQVHGAVRERLSPAERHIFGVRGPMHIFVESTDDGTVVIDVEGMEAGVTESRHDVAVDFRDPYQLLRLTMDLGVPTAARVSHISYSFGQGRPDREPFARFTKETAEHAAAYNRHQPKERVELDAAHLAGWLEAQLEDRFLDALALWEALGCEGPTPARHEAYLLSSRTSDPMMGAPICAYGTQASTQTKVHCTLADEPIAGWGFDQLQKVFGVDFERMGGAALDHALADLAGFAPEDIDSYLMRSDWVGGPR